MSPGFRSYVLVSLGQIARNYQSVRRVVSPGVEVAGVVKADAYGHGALEVSRVLEAEGARWLAVSSVDEGVTLREGGIRAPRILVMGGFLPDEGAQLAEFDLTPAVHSLSEIRQVDRLAECSGKPIPYHLKIDSGMGRLGTRASASEILAVLGDTRHARLEGLMTHFASAANYDSEQTAGQLARFHAVAAELRAAGVDAPILHTSSTIAVAYGRSEGWHNLVRAGHALYGYVSPARGAAPPQLLRVAPALTWKARILQIKDLPEGALVGYGGTFRTPRPMRIGVVGAGYADGVFHRLFEPRQGHRRRQAGAHPRHHLHGPDHHRPQPHHRALPRRRRHAPRERRRVHPGRPAARPRRRHHFVQHPVQHQRPGEAGVRAVAPGPNALGL